MSRRGTQLTDLSQWRGKRLSPAAPGSGGFALAAVVAATTLQPLGRGGGAAPAGWEGNGAGGGGRSTGATRLGEAAAAPRVSRWGSSASGKTRTSLGLVAE
nr:unnamed protein product [Digitaria exilis]